VSLVKRRITVYAVLAVLCACVCCAGCRPDAQNTTAAPLDLIFDSQLQGTEANILAQIVQAQMQQNHIPTKLDPLSDLVYNDRLAKLDYVSGLGWWYTDYSDPEGYLSDFYSKGTCLRMAKYSSPDFDREYLAGLHASDISERDKHYHLADAILMKDLPWIPVVTTDDVFVMTKSVVGFTDNELQSNDYRYVPMREIRTTSEEAVLSVDPAQDYDLGSKNVGTPSYDGLVALDASNRIIPALATSWSWSANVDQLTFHLRSNVRFHPSDAFRTGTLTSEDVRFSFERAIQENSPYAYVFDYVTGVGDFKAGKAPHVSGFLMPDALTFTIALDRPMPTMLRWLLEPGAVIVPHTLPHGYDFSKGSVGTGPFILRSFDGATASYVANGDYYLRDESGGKLPRAAKLSIRVVSQPSAMLAAFTQGEIDILKIPLALYPEFLSLDGTAAPKWRGYNFQSVPIFNLRFLCFNMREAPWGASEELRHQVESAIDRDAIVTKIYRGHARPALNIIPQDIYRVNAEGEGLKSERRL
jgi:ABC-type transport system substrate-binding protein